MIRLPILSALVLATIAACTTTGPAPEPGVNALVSSGRPLDVRPADAGLATVRADLVATAADRFGRAALDQALAAPAHLIAKRFMGMVPPPPPGAGPDWVAPTPTALLMKTTGGWMVATPNGWRAARPEAAAEIDRVIANAGFWSEAPVNMPCPDYGSSQLLLKVPGKPETVRNSMCTSIAEKAVLAALNA
jgi:hypothetical protein